MPYVLYLVYIIFHCGNESCIRFGLSEILRDFNTLFDSSHSNFISFTSIALKMKLVKLIDYSSSLKIVNQAYHELLT